MTQETLEKTLVVAGLDALRQIGGEALVEVLLAQAGTEEFAAASLTDRVPLEAYLRYRDTALDFLQDSFSSTAFETGRILARRMRNKDDGRIQMLIAQFAHAANKLPVIGQAAVLAAKGNPGSVRASMRSEQLLLITIENCPECRGLKRDEPFCFLNQGVITEFAEGHLGLRVRTQEAKCRAMGDRTCEIEVTFAT